jgi:anti-anti-sigma factor
MNDEFNLQSEIFGNTIVVKTNGYINNVAGEKISQLFTSKADSNLKNVIFDLEKSKVVNSIGISYLLEVIERFSEDNGRVVFINLDPSVEKTFNIMGILEFAKTADSLDSALAGME